MQNNPSVAVCILAHNEARYIERTIQNILNTDGTLDFNLTVYANGCTDDTYSIVKKLSDKNNKIRSVEIKIASKINAWNTAFNEHTEDVLIFCDGDVVPEKNAVIELVRELTENDSRIIVSTRLYPLFSDVSLERFAIGLLQLPLKHEFLSGGMYAFKREKLKQKFISKKLPGIPMGVTGEDYFLEHMVESNEFYMSKCKNFYEPPTLSDYIRYLARIRWQNSQMKMIVGEHRDAQISKGSLLLRKFTGHKNYMYLLVSIPAVVARGVFKKMFSKKINLAYEKLGPVVLNGEQILTSQTRSHSTK
jgi:glycosyltransferase involved in cell wall biosynthesis